ncbi:FecR domain-containing protein [Chryseolinea sp. H1M3-3]|uniref:FecR family protein n=1 Tax=Chryseolinea sp. H1M3-3 TaxID=3034144 RepID=UPI0023EBDBE2|nr:FecR domain-containing protein [Chryseolinea sp. H1M3-3]
METDQPELESLFLKKLSGTLSPNESIYLEDRLKSNSQDRSDFEETRSVWKTSDQLQLPRGLSRNVRWNNLQQKIQSTSTHSVPTFKSLLKYAASLTVIGALIGIYLFTSSDELIEITTKYAETKTVTLPDQSTIILNAGTSISYDEDSWDDERLINLEGEAFFNVKKNGAPFTVASNNTTVRVLGTSFNVRSRNEITDVICLTGKVKFSILDRQSVVLTKGNGATATGNNLSPAYAIALVDTMPWITGALYFNDTPLKEVFAEMERYFNVRIIIKKDVGTLTFTGKFSKPQLNVVAETVCLSAGLRYTINKESITIE